MYTNILVYKITYYLYARANDYWQNINKNSTLKLQPTTQILYHTGFPLSKVTLKNSFPGLANEP